jgi:hypothetical protein
MLGTESFYLGCGYLRAGARHQWGIDLTVPGDENHDHEISSKLTKCDYLEISLERHQG